MKRILYSMFLAICLVLGISSISLAAEPQANVNARDYYLSVIKDYHTKPIVCDMQGLVTTPFGTISIEADVTGYAPDAKVFKSVFKIDTMLLGKEKQTKEAVAYYEQSKKKIVAYTYSYGSWKKQTTLLKDNDLYNKDKLTPEYTMQFVKSIEFVSNTPESAELKILLDFDKLSKKIIETLETDKSMFKMPAEKQEVLDLCQAIAPAINNMALYYHINKQDNSMSFDMDLSKPLREIVVVVVDKLSKKMTTEDKKSMAEFLAGSTLTFKSNMKLMDKPEVITVPEEAKLLAKEIKTPKKSAPVKKEDVE